LKRLFLAFALLFTGVFMAEPVYNSAPMVEQPPRDLIPKLRCTEGLGTGFVIEPNVVITAEHVSGPKGSCAIVERARKKARRVVVDRVELPNDFSRLVSRYPVSKRPPLEFVCRPMTKGETYYLIGYPMGGEKLVTYPLVATDIYFTGRHPSSGRLTPHLRFTYGNSYPGMSGGPVIDSNGRVIAFLQSRAIDGDDGALVKELADTSLCRSDK
jgi:hypothetical protein